MDIHIFITSDLITCENRISPQWSVHYLKQRIEHITGIAPEYQCLRYLSVANSADFEVISKGFPDYNIQADKETFLSSFSIVDYSRLHVVDTNPDLELHDLVDDGTEIEGFVLSEEDYAARKDSVLQWKKDNLLGRFDIAPKLAHVINQKKESDQSQELVVGNRCRVIYSESERRGWIKFVGEIDVLDNGSKIWVGVEFDKPLGKNDGSIQGKRLFTCKLNHGSFVHPSCVEQGDFPELDNIDQESISEDEC